MYQEGAFSSPDYDTQVLAGWYEWECSLDELLEKTKRFAKPILMLKNSERINLDSMFIWFTTNITEDYPPHDDFKICDIETGVILYQVFYKSPFDDKNTLWTVFPYSEMRMTKGLQRKVKTQSFSSTIELENWLNCVKINRK